ncbi:MAG: CRISPR-associated protein [Leptolyngbya sp. SIO1E4]|nr:CRISPR-associated protein [Leptolyngbya sp. SIO1E4]
MSKSKPIKKSSQSQKPSPPKKRVGAKLGASHQPNPIPDTQDKPYGLVPLTTQGIDRQIPVGQDKFKHDRFSGKLHLALTVQTASFVASGVVAMGRDVDLKADLIKTAVHQKNQLIIPGSSLKGVVRSTYEALTRSCLCKTKAKRDEIPKGHGECKIQKDKIEVCPACRVFGAMGWQGLVAFPDAVGQKVSTSVGFMPSLYRPRTENPMYQNDGKVSGRKFYYHAVKAVNAGEQRGIPVQQAGQAYVFKTALQFKNLTEAELGTLLVILGQDSDYPMALKVGGGKPIGMGSMVVTVEALEKPGNLKSRYTHYVLPDSDHLTDEPLKRFMQTAIVAAHQTLIEEYQLKELARILAWPTQRPAPEGMY